MKKNKQNKDRLCGPHSDHMLFTEEENNMAKIVFTSILFIYLALLIGFSIAPASSIEGPIVTNFGTLLHYLGYLFLFPIMALCFYSNDMTSVISKSIYWGIGIAIFTEVAQLFIPGRSGNISDLAINLVGLFSIPIILLIAMAELEEQEGGIYYDSARL